MHVLLIGSGGREHALGWALAHDPGVSKLTSLPGNPGLAQLGECLTGVAADDVPGITAKAKEIGADFVVIGPEAPLAAGLADALRAAGLACFGPSKAAAQLEASKGFMKDLCAEHNIPTAAYGRFSDASSAKAKLRTFAPPYVVKADGLAAGKGVIIAQGLEEADRAVDEIFGGKFGSAGTEVVIEEFLNGEEASFFALTDGEAIMPLIAAQDHKRAYDNDEGPNTGGMGAYSPAPVFTPEIEQDVLKRIIQPTVAGMAARGTPYKGVLYAGLMITTDGPKLIEYNVRFGDPECQLLMLRWAGGLLDALRATDTGGLANVDVTWHTDSALCVVMAAKGYPNDYRKGTPICGLDAASSTPGVKIFHAGTALIEGQLAANGGRVLNVCARAGTIGQARARAYDALAKIDWPDGFARSDIAWRALEPTNE